MRSSPPAKPEPTCRTAQPAANGVGTTRPGSSDPGLVRGGRGPGWAGWAGLGGAGADFRAHLLSDPMVAGRVSEAAIDAAMGAEMHLAQVDVIFARVFGA
ncbi:MAG: hypothetical protein POH28_13105 [Acidocella sp.]|nr:hypothetical protein [Acidocella sp.]